MLGYGLAGISRRFLVYPSAMIWPTNLVNASLFHALHDHSKTDPAKANGWTIGRYKYFLIVFVCSFTWYWFPGFIAPFLSVFAFVCWIRPNNVTINQLFGGWTGLSLIPITFDWTQIAGYASSPLVPPAHAIINTLIGVVLFFWFTTMGLHYTGTWYADYLPISDSNSYDNTGNLYNVSKILTPQYTLDLDKYHDYSPLFLSTTFALTYGLSFASIAATVVHVALFHGADIWARVRNLKDDNDDIHYRMMMKYREAPWYWYAVLFLIMFGMGMGVSVGYETNLSWWAFIVSLIIAIVWFVPIGIIQGITSIQIGLNVFTEFLVGYIQPGRPTAMMLFKTYGYITMSQGLYFAQDLKLGQYMKVPQRSMFWSQTIATIWACIVQIAVLEWALGGGISDVCTQHQSNNFTCPNGRVFFNASVIVSNVISSHHHHTDKHAVGSHRSTTHLLPRSHLRQPAILLARRCIGARARLLRRTRIPEVTYQIPLLPHHLRRIRTHPTRHTTQLSLLGSRRPVLQQIPAQQISRLVDAFQLHYQCRS